MRKWLVVCLAASACANNVSQIKQTGTDGSIKGAKPIVFAENETEVKTKGIVTYPGGDRVDWKTIELPAGTHGKLDLQLTWHAPRPGLHVAFDVFDQWNTPVIAKNAAHSRTSRMQMATIDNARGKYFVRVFAPKRGDAGEYTLVASYEPENPPPRVDMVVPDPPRLPAVPPTEPDCDPFDVKVKACEKVCPEAGAPAGWIGCRDRDKQEQEKAACEQAKKDLADRQKTAPTAFTARMNHVEIQGDDSVITLPAGTTAHPQLDKTWTAQVLSSQNGQPIAGAAATIVRVGNTQTLARVHMTIDQLSANPQVRLTPPADLAAGGLPRGCQ